MIMITESLAQPLSFMLFQWTDNKHLHHDEDDDVMVITIMNMTMIIIIIMMNDHDNDDDDYCQNPTHFFTLTSQLKSTPPVL